MAKKQPEKKSEPVEVVRFPVWGYGFRQIGAKWAAHRIDSEGNREDLTPPSGVQLHRAIACAQKGLADELARMRRVAK